VRHILTYLYQFHCHVGWHAEAGLGMVFATRAEGMGDWEVPAEVGGLCGVEGVERGMGPDDGVWFGRREKDGGDVRL